MRTSRSSSRRLGAFLFAAVTASLAGARLHAAEGHPHWTYKGKTGPAVWGGLEKDYAACGTGKEQSPIDIRDQDAKSADLPAIEFDYKPSAAKIIDNGHSIQINLDPGSSIIVGDKTYGLVQFHFHKPSEEEINGKTSDMVAHLVHKDAEGKLAVVAVLLRKGASSPLIKTLWSQLPKEKEKETPVAGKVDPAGLLPSDRAYYTFMGSLTTPPCSEGVQWFVLRTPSEISSEQVTAFGARYPLNARPVQPLNGRVVQASK